MQYTDGQRKGHAHALLNITERDIPYSSHFREVNFAVSIKGGDMRAVTASLKERARVSLEQAETLHELEVQGWTYHSDLDWSDSLDLLNYGIDIRCAPMTYRRLADIRHELDCVAPDDLSDACVDLIAAFCGYPFEVLPPRSPSREVIKTLRASERCRSCSGGAVDARRDDEAATCMSRPNHRIAKDESEWQ